MSSEGKGMHESEGNAQPSTAGTESAGIRSWAGDRSPSSAGEQEASKAPEMPGSPRWLDSLVGQIGREVATEGARIAADASRTTGEFARTMAPDLGSTSSRDMTRLLTNEVTGGSDTAKLQNHAAQRWADLTSHAQTPSPGSGEELT
jgi:hypothetical protein